MKLPLLAAAFAAVLAMSAPAPAAAEETEYANLGRWRVMTVSNEGGFVYCAADTDNGQVQLRIATDGRTWQIGVPYYDQGPVRGQWGFDGWEDEASFRTDGDGWAVMDVNQHILYSLDHMDNFSIEIDRGPQHFALRGSSAALKKAVECARNKGARVAAKAAAKTDGRRGIDWVRGRSDKPIDRRAVAIGLMPDGMPVFVCVANYNGGVHPGMAAMWIEGCSTGYGGNAVVVPDYSLMIGAGRWQRSADGQVPGNALQAGNEADGRPLYVCRVKVDGEVYAGKTRPGFNGCNFADLRGREVTARSFDVLVR